MRINSPAGPSRRPRLEAGQESEERPSPWFDIDTGRRGTLLRLQSSREARALAGGGDHVVNVGGYAGAQSEPAIAVNDAGTVLVAGFNDPAGFLLTPWNISGVARSTDGGATWTTSGPLPTAGENLLGDPDVKYDRAGDRFFYSSLYTDPVSGNQGVCVHRSDAVGLSWSGPFAVTPTLSGGSSDKEMIAINGATGRLLAVWVQNSTFGRDLQLSFSDDGGSTWAAARTLATNAGIQAPQVRVVPGPNASAKVYVVYTQGGSLRRLRSSDGGSTWSPSAELRAAVPSPDEAIGFDRAHQFCALDVDPVNGYVYVVAPVTDGSGTTDIEFFRSTDGLQFSVPIRINSAPGSDGAQLRPAIAVDAITRRIHVTWYDQQGAAGGDRTELMRTHSDDFGISWSAPTPLLDRPFHAAYGDDGSEPNLGDYNACVARGGILHSLAGATPPRVRFDDAQPGDRMGAVDTYHDRRADGPATFTVASNTPWSAATGTAWALPVDVSGDGRLDLVSANESGSVTVRLGQGAGGFGPATSYPVAGGPVAVDVGDLNHDLRPDLVTANFTAGTVSVLLNLGGGSFGTASSFLSGSGTSGVATGDLNGDGHLDCVTTNSTAGNIAVFTGNGAGSLSGPVTYPTAGPSWVATGDFNLDGRPDVATAHPGSNSIQVRLNDGAGLLGATFVYLVGTSPNFVGAGDANGDGYLDLVSASLLGGTVSVLAGNGSGIFGVAAMYPVPTGPGSVAIGDFDNDGWPDLAVSHDSNSHELSVLRGNGFAFGPPSSLSVASNSRGVASGDVNGDGRPDLVSADHDAGSVSVLVNGVDPTDYREVALRLESVTMTDPCAAGSNGRLDPGEVGAFTFTIRNYVSNALYGPPTYTQAVGTLTSPTPGVTVGSPPLSFGSIGPMATASNATAFQVGLDAGFVPGTDIELLLTVQTDQGVARLRRRVPTGSPGATVALIDESFEGASAPALPPGWSSSNGGGANEPWITSTTRPGGSPGNLAAFHANAGAQGWNRLYSPSVTVPTPAAGGECFVTLDFDIAYALEHEPARKVLAHDGCYLRIHDLTGGAYTVRSVNAAAFAEEFLTGTWPGYDHRSPSGGSFGTADQWSGSSQGTKHVSMKFPGAGLAGHTIQLRFEFQEDGAGTCLEAGLTGPCGVSIDNLALRYVPVVSQPCTPVGVPLAGPVAFGLRGVSPNPSSAGHLTVRFALSSDAPARLELFDATGRMVRGEEVGAFGPGEHSLRLTGATGIAQGIYFVRLRQAGRESVRRAVVLR